MPQTGHCIRQPTDADYRATVCAMGLALVGAILILGGLYAISGGAVLTAALLGISGAALMLVGALSFSRSQDAEAAD